MVRGRLSLAGKRLDLSLYVKLKIFDKIKQKKVLDAKVANRDTNF